MALGSAGLCSVGTLFIPALNERASVPLVLAAILFWGDLLHGPQPAPSALGDISPRHMLPDEVRDHSKETKPCDVLPPLRG